MYVLCKTTLELLIGFKMSYNNFCWCYYCHYIHYVLMIILFLPFDIDSKKYNFNFF